MNVDHLTINDEILTLISELDEFKGAWRALGTLAPERLSALRRVATIESIGSSTRIEGSQLSDSQVETVLSNLKIKSFHTRDEQEVAGYGQLMELIFLNFKKIDLSENVIKQLHRECLQYSHKDQRHRGEYKKLDNHVEAFDDTGKSIGVVFRTATPFETPDRMRELIQWFNRAWEEKIHHPLIIIALFIVVFLEIHPFQDGNGRLSRALTTLLLLKSGYTYVPYSSLENVIEQSKESYYQSLRKTQCSIRKEKPNWNPWIIYFLHTLQQQKRKLEVKVESAQIMQKQLPVLSLDILERVKQHGRITISDAVAATSGNRNTIKKHLRNLVLSRHLTKQGRGKATWYILS